MLAQATSFTALAQSSGGSPGSHAANNAGFSQPPTLAPASPPTAANPNATSPNNVNPNINGSTPGVTNGSAPGFLATNAVDAFGDTNNSTAAGFSTNSGVAPGFKALNPSGVNPQSPANPSTRMNADGDVTNANGTMTFNTNSPHWWEKK